MANEEEQICAHEPLRLYGSPGREILQRLLQDRRQRRS